MLFPSELIHKNGLRFAWAVDFCFRQTNHRRQVHILFIFLSLLNKKKNNNNRLYVPIFIHTNCSYFLFMFFACDWFFSIVNRIEDLAFFTLSHISLTPSLAWMIVLSYFEFWFFISSVVHSILSCATSLFLSFCFRFLMIFFGCIICVFDCLPLSVFSIFNWFDR